MIPLLPFRGPALPFWLLAGFLLLVLLAGGGSRSDVPSLLLIRPVAGLLFIVGLFGLTELQRERHAVLLALMFAAMGLVALQLLPLPPFLWQLLPDRASVVQIDAVAELGAIWRPVSLVPWRTANALFALLVPAAILLLAIQLPGIWQRRLLWLILGVAVISAALGLFQRMAPSESPLFFYRITNEGSAVGLFSNRNHHAMFLAACLPLLAFEMSFAAKSRELAVARSWIGAAVGLLFVAVIVTTGSRAGIAIGALALASLPFLYRQPDIRGGRGRLERGIDLKRRGKWIIAALAVLLVAFATSSALLERIAESDGSDEIRWQIWPPIVQATWRLFPVGSGAGTFVEAYQVIEPIRLLGDRYVNHAHNDLLEVAMTLGLPGLLLIGVAVYAWIRLALPLWRAGLTDPQVHLGRVGSVVTLAFALGSLADYPLRTPSVSAFFIMGALWMVQGGTALAASARSGGESTGGALAL